MLVWILGAGGQLGSALKEHCTLEKIPFVASGHVQADITDLEQLKQLSEQLNPTHIINCAAYTDVDGAEKNGRVAYAVNARGAENVGIIAREMGIKVVHVSTDYVFAGDKDSPYLETDRPNPLGVYGRASWKGNCASLNSWELLVLSGRRGFLGRVAKILFLELWRCCGQKSRSKQSTIRSTERPITAI